MEMFFLSAVVLGVFAYAIWSRLHRPKEDAFETRPWETYRAPTTRQNRNYRQGAPSTSRSTNGPHTYDSSVPLYPYVPPVYDSTPSETHHHSTHHDTHTPSSDYGGSGGYDGGSGGGCDTGSSDSGGGGSDGGGGGCD